MGGFNAFFVVYDHFAKYKCITTVCIDTQRQKSNTRGNISKISVNQSLKGFPITFHLINHEGELVINTF